MLKNKLTAEKITLSDNQLTEQIHIIHNRFQKHLTDNNCW